MFVFIRKPERSLQTEVLIWHEDGSVEEGPPINKEVVLRIFNGNYFILEKQVHPFRLVSLITGNGSEKRQTSQGPQGKGSKKGQKSSGPEGKFSTLYAPSAVKSMHEHGGVGMLTKNQCIGLALCYLDFNIADSKSKEQAQQAVSERIPYVYEFVAQHIGRHRRSRRVIQNKENK